MPGSGLYNLNFDLEDAPIWFSMRWIAWHGNCGEGDSIFDFDVFITFPLCLLHRTGTLEGCADGTPITGVEPNEHGTWLYGRNGWCNGREVDPWVIDITSQLTHDVTSHKGDFTNNINYFGWYNGGDPNPHAEPGYIVMYSYLVYYKASEAQPHLWHYWCITTNSMRQA